MTKQEFLNILECVLKTADEHISLIDFPRDSQDAVEIYYDDDILYSIPISNKSLLEILCVVTMKCCEVRGINDWEQELRTLQGTQPDPGVSYEDWKEAITGKEDADKLLYYLYRMTPVEKDYIYGKMAAVLLEWRSASNPRLQPNEDE